FRLGRLQPDGLWRGVVPGPAGDAELRPADLRPQPAGAVAALAYQPGTLVPRISLSAAAARPALAGAAVVPGAGGGVLDLGAVARRVVQLPAVGPVPRRRLPAVRQAAAPPAGAQAAAHLRLRHAAADRPAAVHGRRHE